MSNVVYNKDGIPFDIDALVTDVNGKADVDLSNTSPSSMFKSNSVSWCMPDYENQITGSSKNWVQCSKDSFICIWGFDSYTEDFKAQVSPNNGTDIFTVGVRSDDVNSNTQTTSFTFLCPKNWYFRCTSEGIPTYVIYPLKGAN